VKKSRIHSYKLKNERGWNVEAWNFTTRDLPYPRCSWRYAQDGKEIGGREHVWALDLGEIPMGKRSYGLPQKL
jgi:hypothetical protein